MKGIIRIAAATPRLHLGDPRANVTELVRLASAVSADGAAAIVFPELCLTGYTCGDLFFRSDLLSAAESALADFAAATAKLPIIAIVGFPQREGDLPPPSFTGVRSPASSASGYFRRMRNTTNGASSRPRLPTNR